jgi:hypothetical protein
LWLCKSAANCEISLLAAFREDSGWGVFDPGQLNVTNLELGTNRILNHALPAGSNATATGFPMSQAATIGKAATPGQIMHYVLASI